MKINSRIKRMDSLMVAANIKAEPTGAAIYLYLKPCNISRKKGQDDKFTGMEHHYDPGQLQQSHLLQPESRCKDRLKTISSNTDVLPSACNSD